MPAGGRTGPRTKQSTGDSVKRTEAISAAVPSPEAERLVLCLSESSEPVGARHAARLLAERGIELSEASVSRVFLQLDRLGLTEAVGRKGRVLTDLGRQHAARRLSESRRNDEFGRALDIRTVQQLGDWLHARRGIEGEVARAAAERARKADVTRLSRLLSEHQRSLAAGTDPTPVAMRFHQELARATRSPLFEALVNSLHGTEVIHLEELLDKITGGHGTIGDSTGEHTELLEAVRSGDGDTAEAAMRAHLDRLIEEVEEFASGKLGDLLPRLLAVRPPA